MVILSSSSINEPETEDVKLGGGGGRGEERCKHTPSAAGRHNLTENKNILSSER